VIYSKKVQIRNNIDFEIQNLSLELKRKEILIYNPLHYAFGYVLESKPWLSYADRYL
jgi:hypothetical protein